MWIASFYVNSLYFQQWNSNWDIAFLGLSLDSKLRFFDEGFRLYSKLFPNSQKDWKLGFANVLLVRRFNFFQSMKEMEYWDLWLLP